MGPVAPPPGRVGPPLLAVALAACNGDTGVIVYNNPPTAEFTSPASGHTVAEGSEITFLGQAGDPDDAPEDLSVDFLVEGVALCPDVAANGNGVALCDAVLDVGSWDVLFVVTDPDGEADTARINVTVVADQAPTAQILAPEADSTWSTTASVSLAGLVSDDLDLPSALLARWESDIDGVLAEDLTPDNDGAVAGTVRLSEGRHQLRLIAEDSRGHEGVDTVFVDVLGPDLAPPEITWATPSDGATFDDGDLITLSVVADDLETASSDLGVTLESDVDGEIGAGHPDDQGRFQVIASLSPGAHVLHATVTDGDHLTATSPLAVTINGRPGAPQVSLSPSSPGTDDALQATIAAEAVDPDGDPLTYRWAWSVDGASSSASTSGTLPATATSRGQVWTARAFASDGRIEGPAGEASVTIGNTAPVTSRPTLSPTQPTEAGPITCAPGASSDADGDAVSFRYAWTVGGQAVSTASDALPASAFAKGQAVICTVTPHDGAADGAPVASLPATVGNSAPTASTPTLTPDPAYTESVLSVGVSGQDPDGDALSWTYAWTVNGNAAGTGATLNGATAFARGDRVKVTVTPHDGTVAGTPATSAERIIANSPPRAPGVTLTPDDPVVDDDPITCAVTTPSTDADGDGVSYTYRWTVDGTNYTPPSDPKVVPLTEPIAGELWSCAVTASDGAVSGPAGSDSARVVLYAHMQWPCPSATGNRGQSFDFYGVVYDKDTTPGPERGAGVTDAQLGMGPEGTDPRVASGWTWTNGAYNGDINAFTANDKRNDEYKATVTLPSVAGRYAAVWRFSPDHGVSWGYGDLGSSYGADACDAYQGNSDGFSPAQALIVTVQ